MEAAENGQLEMLKWLKKGRFSLNKCVTAAGSHLNVLKCARENGTRWNRRYAKAVSKGDLPMLKWAREQGCPWSKSTVTSQLSIVRC